MTNRSDGGLNAFAGGVHASFGEGGEPGTFAKAIARRVREESVADLR